MVPGIRYPFPLREPWPRIIGIPLLGTLLGLIYNDPPYQVWRFLLSIAITGVIWMGDYAIIMAMRRRLPEASHTWKRVLLSITLVGGYNMLVDTTLCELLIRFKLQNNEYLANAFWVRTAMNMGIAFFVGTLYEAGYFFGQWKKQLMETEQVKSQHLRSELSVLKNQISPHFLFNSLNTLVTLIHEDAQQAARFTQKLSDVYRYILQHKDKEVVDLRTELEFTEAYNYLMKMRFEQSIDIRLNVDEGPRSLLIAPLTLQMLVENAVKHNVASIASPLRVDIYVENGRSLIVRNTLRRKQTVEGSTGTGLANIKLRYAYLSDREVDVIETREHFLVALPLLEMAAHPETVRA